MCAENLLCESSKVWEILSGESSGESSGERTRLRKCVRKIIKLNILTTTIFQYDDILKKYNESMTSSNENRLKAILKFEFYMGGVREASQLHTTSCHWVRKGKIGQHKDGVVMWEY